MALKSWDVTIIVYTMKSKKDKFMRMLKVNGKDEQTVRRLVLDAVHEEEEFIHEFLAVERAKA